MIELAAGGSAMVRFNADEQGGRLVVYDGTGATLADQWFPSDVADLPLFAAP